MKILPNMYEKIVLIDGRTGFVVEILEEVVAYPVILTCRVRTGIYSSTISSLDNKKETVMALSAAAATTSAAITLLPGDTMTPIADKMADLTSYFLIILCVIYLEKYLLPILGYLVFGILIPIVFILKGIDYYKDVKKILESAKKLVLIGLVILLSIPISEKVSGIIHETYESSIENTINEATQEITIEEDGTVALKLYFQK